MPPTSLTEDEFRLLAYIRAYADNADQSLDPSWVQAQLQFSLSQLQEAARNLVARGLAEFFEFDPAPGLLRVHPEMRPGPIPSDIELTETGWNYLPPS